MFSSVIRCLAATALVCVAVPVLALPNARIINGVGFDVSKPVESLAEFERNWNYTAGYGTYQYPYFYRQCGASYLGEGWFLTAAHCLANQATDVVAFGHYLTNEQVLVDVQQAYAHPLYDAGDFSFDLALLKVSPDDIAAYGNYDGLVLPKRASVPAYAQAPSQNFRIAGWGATSPLATDPRPANNLQRANLSLQSDNTCTMLYGDVYDPEVMLCALGAQQPVQDSCQGDSGSGLLAFETLGMENGEPLLGREVQGVVSYGGTCAEAASVYARTDDPWLNAMLSGANQPETVGLAVESYFPTSPSTTISQGQITFTNTSASPLSLNNLNAKGFSITSSGCSAALPPGDSCSITLQNETTKSARALLEFYVKGEQVVYPLYQRVISQPLADDENFLIHPYTNWEYNELTATLTAPAYTGQVVFEVKQSGFLVFDLSMNIAESRDVLNIDANKLGGRVALDGQCTESLAVPVEAGDNIAVFYGRYGSNALSAGNFVQLSTMTIENPTDHKLITRSNCVVAPPEYSSAASDSGSNGNSAAPTKAGSAHWAFMASILLALFVCRRNRFYS